MTYRLMPALHGRWMPMGTKFVSGRHPAVGDVVPIAHGVWRVTAVREDPVLDDDDRDAWVNDGMPEVESWWRRPYTVEVVHLGGVAPAGMRPGQPCRVRVKARTYMSWQAYPNARWPGCSCCGEPMPCRAELADRTVAAAEAHVTVLESRLPGCCWSCGEPVTSRQRAVTYPGINLDLPTAESPRFHLRAKCRHTAEAYERRWLNGGPGRDRVITWPTCPGSLVVHHDGTTECHAGHDDCRGHETHDHGHVTGCVYQSHGCGRDCPREGHPGTSHADRPPRRSGLLT